MDNGKPDLRLFIAVPRSGSTLFMRVMAAYSELAVTSRNVLMGHMQPRDISPGGRNFIPDYRIFSDLDHPIYQAAQDLKKRLIVSKEEFGNDRNTGTPELNECNFRMFPNDDAFTRTKPVFTFRRPYEVFDSWLSKGWTDIESFVTVYKNHIRTFQKALSMNEDTVFYTYEYLVESRNNQINVFNRVCNYWSINFKEGCLDFKSNFGSDFVYQNDREREIYLSENPKGIFTTLMNSKGIQNDVTSHGLLLPEHMDLIDNELMESYNYIHQKSLLSYEVTSNPFSKPPIRYQP